MVSDSSDIERQCTPCANAAKSELAGGRRIDGRVGRAGPGFGDRYGSNEVVGFDGSSRGGKAS
jgi:hypothetical protein